MAVTRDAPQRDGERDREERAEGGGSVGKDSVEELPTLASLMAPHQW